MTIESIIRLHYPYCIGAILSGSYATPKTSNSQSDIDILVFDPSFSVVSTRIINQDKQEFDFTQVPLCNLADVLKNSHFDEKGVLINMIKKGEIIFDDKFSSIKLIQEIANKLYTYGAYNTNAQYTVAMSNLNGIKQQLNKELTPINRIFLLNEFFTTITSAVLIKSNNWHSSSKHKFQTLSLINPLLLDEITDLFLNSIEAQNKISLSRIVNYINNFQRFNLFENGPRKYNQTYWIFDLDFEEFNFNIFVTKVLPAIKSENDLKEKYQSFYISQNSKSNIYRNRLCIVFKIHNTLPKTSILEKLLKIFESLNLKVNYSEIPTYEINEETFGQHFFRNFDACGKILSLLTESQILEYGQYDGKRTIIITLILTSFVLYKLNSDKEIQKILLFLVSKYSSTRIEQNNNNNTNALLKLRIQKNKQYNKYYLDNKVVFDAAIDKGIELSRVENVEKINNNKSYYPSLIELHNFITSDDELYISSDIYQQMSYHILNNYFKMEKPEKAIKSILLLEHTAQHLCLSEVQLGLLISIFINYRAKPVQNQELS